MAKQDICARPVKHGKLLPMQEQFPHMEVPTHLFTEKLPADRLRLGIRFESTPPRYDGKAKTLHIFMIEAILGRNLADDEQGDHGDNDARNNKLSNLSRCLLD